MSTGLVVKGVGEYFNICFGNSGLVRGTGDVCGSVYVLRSLVGLVGWLVGARVVRVGARYTHSLPFQ